MTECLNCKKESIIDFCTWKCAIQYAVKLQDKNERLKELLKEAKPFINFSTAYPLVERIEKELTNGPTV